MTQESPQDEQDGQADPRQDLPRVTFTKFYDEEENIEAYRVSMDRELIEIPAVVSQAGKSGIGILFSIRPDDVVPVQDVLLMIDKAAGFVFEIVHPEDSFSSVGAAIFSHTLKTEPDASAKMKAGEVIETDLARLIPMTDGDVAQALNNLQKKHMEDKDKGSHN